MTEKLKPCKKCKSVDIELWDCGYNTFNPQGGKCRNCGYEVKINHGPADPTQEGLIKLWNNGQKKSELEILQEKSRTDDSLLQEMAEVLTFAATYVPDTAKATKYHCDKALAKYKERINAGD